MATITASMVKELREKTGAGMMDCKTALNETGGDLQAASDWLRAKGLAQAAKKAGRTAAEGLIGVAWKDDEAALVEVNSETDFVARNEIFQEMVQKIAEAALGAKGDLDALEKAGYPGGKGTVAETLKETVGSIGENMQLRRTAYLTAGHGIVAHYIHNAMGTGLGKIGVIVALNSTGDKEALGEFGRQLAMHVAASNPQVVTAEGLDKDLVERERNVLVEQAKESGKPDNVIEKMVEGRLRKFYEEVVLLSQTYVLDSELTVEKAVEQAQKAVGAPIEIAGFHRYALGEGVEVSEEE